jgi:methionine sulfoxide reductase heme-binding subunit
MTQLWWDTARAGGIVAWALLAASVLWGLTISMKASPRRLRPSWMLDVHRFLGGLAVVFVGVHVASIVLDSYVHFGLTEILVPLASSWHPVAVAWGIVGMYLLLAVELTSLARRRLPRRAWRTVHALSFPTFALATVHGITAGTDRGNLVWQVALWGTVAAVTFLTVVRLLQLSEPAPAPTPSAEVGAPWPAPDAMTRRVPTGPPLR